MSIEVILPKVGFAEGETKLAEWMVEDGGTVKEGAPLFAFETDKSTNEVEAPASGILRIKVQAGEVVDVGTVIGIIEKG